MAKWLEQTLKTMSSSIVASMHALESALHRWKWVSPLDFGLMRRQLPRPEELADLSFADRGVLVFELHRARSTIQREASIVLQMLFRRIILNGKLQRRSKCLMHLKLLELSPTQDSLSTTFNADVYQITSEVLTTLDTVIDAVVDAVTKEFEATEEILSIQGDPVRTEFRNLHSSLAGSIEGHTVAYSEIEFV